MRKNSSLNLVGRISIIGDKEDSQVPIPEGRKVVDTVVDGAQGCPHVLRTGVGEMVNVVSVIPFYPKIRD